MVEHDNSYKLVFSHARMVEDLMRGFVHEPWVEDLDFSTLERVNASFVADSLKARESDVVWRLRWSGRWLYLYILIEFQSRSDPWMALRIMTYLGLLYQEIIRQDDNGALADNKLPPVLPVVLYNGIPRWQSAVDVAELIQPVPAGLGRYRPSLRYLLLDEGALDESGQLALRNLAAALFRLEKSSGPEDMREMVGALAAWLKAPEQTSLRRAFTVWIRRVLLPARMPGVNIPELVDLQEVQTMLAERVMEWTEQWKQQGMQQACNKGTAGHAAGHAAGKNAAAATPTGPAFRGNSSLGHGQTGTGLARGHRPLGRTYP